MTQEFEEAPHPIFYCAEPFLKGDLKSKKARDTIHSQSTTQTKTIISRTFFGMQSVMRLRRSVCLV